MDGEASSVMVAAKAPFQRQCDVGTIPMNLKVIWEMSLKLAILSGESEINIREGW